MFLSLGILLLCQFTFITQASQQCRLKLQDTLVQPTLGSSGGSETGGGETATPTKTAGSPSSTSSTSIPFTTFRYGQDKIRGVNLGGWFVLEPWIVPSLFIATGNDNIVDEYTLGQLYHNASALLDEHWRTFYTEDDFIAIHAAGLTHVRIPLGYWSVPLTSSDTTGSTSTDPYTPGAWPYLLSALNWARKHDVHVILDIHGAPGSQNGYDNSGQRTSNPQWGFSPANISRTVDTVVFIAEQIGGMLDVIELLNEPAGFLGDAYVAAVRQYWLDGYQAIRQKVGNDLKIMIGDAFLGVNSWTGFMTNDTGVLMDYHEYQIFSNAELARSFDQHIQYACDTLLPTLSSYAASNLMTIAGEWSLAVTDCTQWLNGRGVGARWDLSWTQQPGAQYFGPCTGWSGSYTTFSDDYKTFLRKYWEVQVTIGESADGWIFWTWKAENSDEWSYQKGLEGGYIPQDPTDRLYPNICS